MSSREEKFLMTIALIALAISLIAITIKVSGKLNVNGECIEVEAVEPQETISTEIPVTHTATPIPGLPIYIQTVNFECDEDIEDETLYPTRDEIYCLSRLVHGESSVCSVEVKATVAWIVLNRVDAENYPNTIREVCEQTGQFAGWDRCCASEITVEERKMCYDIVLAWKNFDDRYRTIPSDYLYFRGDGTTNYFTTFFTKSLSEAKRNAWNFTMPNYFKED